MRNFSVKSLAALECTHYKQLNGLFSSVFNMIVVKEGGGGRDNSTDNKKNQERKEQHEKLNTYRRDSNLSRKSSTIINYT